MSWLSFGAVGISRFIKVDLSNNSDNFVFYYYVVASEVVYHCLGYQKYSIISDIFYPRPLVRINSDFVPLSPASTPL